MAVQQTNGRHDFGREDVRKVVLLDEQPLWLDGLEHALRSAGITVVGRATSPHVALELVASERPAALVASLELPSADMDALECLRRARERWASLRIVALSSHDDAFQLAGGAEGGAHAYLPKTAGAAEVAATVLECLATAGRRNGNGNGRLAPQPKGPGLTARELEILHLVARGHTNAQIAQRLWVTKWTVKFHLANAYRKLGVSNRTQAARYIFDRGISALPLAEPPPGA